MTGVAVAESVEVVARPVGLTAGPVSSLKAGTPTGGEPAVAAVRAALSAADNQCNGDDDVRRFIRATNGDLALAAKRLEATTAWRRAAQPERVVCSACAADARSHYMHPVGVDRGGRPVIYSCNGMASEKTFRHNEAHMISCFEQAIRLMPPGVEQWCWVLDFHGFGLSDCNPRLARAFIDLTGAHYPERLGVFFIVSAPRVFNSLWAAIEGFVDPKTRQKIHFVPADGELGPGRSKMLQAMAPHFDADLQRWMVREMAENRAKGAAKKKTHCVRTLYHLTTSQQLAAVAAAEASGEGHSVYGTAQLLTMYLTNPEVLQPQASVPGPCS